MKLTRAFALFLFFCALGLAPAARPALAGSPAAVAGLIKAGDQAFDQRQTPGKAAEAINLFQQAHKLAPNSLAASFKLCRALFWQAQRLSDDAQAMAEYQKALAAADTLVKFHPGHVAGYFMRGACRLLIFSIDHSFSYLSQAKVDLQKALKLDASFDGGGAHRVLGRMYFRLPWLLGGDNKKAIAHLEKAVAAGPRQFSNHYFLAEVLAKTGRMEKAKSLLQTLLAAPSGPGLEPDLGELKQSARKLLQRMTHQPEPDQG